MQFDKKKYKLIIANIEKAHLMTYNENYKKKIQTAKVLIEAGWVEQILDNTFIKNIINLLAPFVQNQKIKEAINLLQQGLKDEEEKRKKRIKKSKFKLRSSVNENEIDELKIYETSQKEKIEFYFYKPKQKWYVIDAANKKYEFFYKINAELKLKELLNNNNYKLVGDKNGNNK